MTDDDGIDRPRQVGYVQIRRVGTSYVVSVTRMCRQIGQVEGDNVRIVLERVD